MQILIVNFELHIFKFKNLKLRQSKHISMSHKLKKNVFVIFHDHYLPKISELKNRVHS
jgi:hypothetical protein